MTEGDKRRGPSACSLRDVTGAHYAIRAFLLAELLGGHQVRTEITSAEMRTDMYTGYYIQDGYIYGPEESGKFYIQGKHIYGPRNSGKYYIQGDYIYGPEDGGKFYIQDGHIYGPDRNVPWMR